MNSGLSLPGVVSASAGSLEQFVRMARQAPYLSEVEERQLGIRLREQGDLDAARQLVMSHLRYVVSVARGYGGYGLPLADLIQEGCVGLMKAVKKFDPSRGVRLVSFATHWIKAEIHEFVVRNWHIVKIATTKAQRKLFFNLRGKKEQLGWLTRDEAGQMAEDLGVCVDEVVEMEGRLAQRSVSFDAMADDDDDSAAPADYLADTRYEPSRAVEEKEWHDLQSNRLDRALMTLDSRSRHILQARWLQQEKSGLKELGEAYGISVERVRQLENQAIKKLQAQLVA